MSPQRQLSRDSRLRFSVAGVLAFSFASLCFFSPGQANAASMASTQLAAAEPPSLDSDDPAMAINRCKKWPANQRFTITIPREAELEKLVNWMMSISCQKFIWSAKVRGGKVTILSPVKVNLREAHAAFYAALQQMGLTVERAGDYYKIVESSEAKKLNLPVYGTTQRGPDNDRFITQLVRITTADPNEVYTVLNELKTKTGSVQRVGNLIILTDRGGTVRRLLDIVSELDEVGGGQRIYFYQLEHAAAEEVAGILREVFKDSSAGGKGKNSSKVTKKVSGAGTDPTMTRFNRVIVDERTGTLIVVAEAPHYPLIEKMISQLDVRLPGGGGRVRIKKLRYADAKDVAKTLQTLTSSRGSSRSKKNSKSSPDDLSSLFDSDIKISPDESTRSLVIAANAAVYKELDKIIDAIDVPRRQVYFEAYLMETVVRKTFEVGAGGHFGKNIPSQNGTGDNLFLLRSSPSPELNSLSVAGAASLSGLTAGILGAGISGTGQLFGLPNDIPAFGAILEALQRNNDVNMMASPHMTIADNDEGLVEIGRRVPTPGALSFGGGGGGSSLVPLKSISREDVTLRIKITPHVNDDSTITMDVEIEDRDIISTDPELGVTTSKRKFALPNIMGYNDQPMVIGGLIRERDAKSTQQVPGLGDIPLIGWLFKRRSMEKEKVNLLVILVPHLVSTPDDVRRIHERRLDERKQFVKAMTRFKHKDLDSMVNYRSKSGLLARIDRVATRLEAEEMLLRQAEADLSQDKISRELGGLQGDSQGGVDVSSSEGGGGTRPPGIVADEQLEGLGSGMWSPRP